MARSEQATPRAEYLFEVSWEVCNKVGGINTVLQSKAALTKQRYPNYLLIGPYVERSAALEFERREPPPPIAAAISAVQQQGIKCHYGVWQIKGEPQAILIDFEALLARKNEFKGNLWNWYHIDSLGAGWDFEEPILFSYAVAQFLLAFEHHLSRPTVAQFHEWMTGAASLFLAHEKSAIRSVFTTHATMLGRAICGSGENLYELLGSIDPLEAAYRHGVQAKHLTEHACAHTADVFTTVSEITAIEAAKLLGKKPDVLVLNGLDISRFPTIEETSIKHITCREKLRAFLSYYFFPHYVFPLEHNLIFFITGRYEFKNKGIDVTIQALGKLNEQMKKDADNPRTVSAFFWIPMQNTGVRLELLENKNYYHHIKNYIQYNSDEILKKVLYDFLAGSDVRGETFFTKEFLGSMKADVLQFRRKGNPALTTHHLMDEGSNDIIKALLAAGLDNHAEQKVKVIVQPVYLDGNDGLVNLPYYDAIAGTHMGLFPSYYEPWGYTPLETAAMGVPSLTTDLAGFGRFIEPFLEEKNPGIRVLHRQDVAVEEIVSRFAQMLYDFVQLDHADRVANKIAAKRLAGLCDWEKFIENYIKAHNLALERTR